MKRLIYLLIPLASLCLLAAGPDREAGQIAARLRGLDTLPTQADTLLPKKADSTLVDSVKVDSTAATGIKEEEAISGIASFYSSNLDGTKTATGEIFRNSKLTAASNHLKLNTWVRVTNLRNNKTVIVRINDRMHPKMKRKGRVVDLSRAAARQLDFIKSGLTRVRLEVVPKGTVE